LNVAGWKVWRYLKFLGLALALCALLIVAGYLPTERFGGGAAIRAMLVGVAVSLLASALGALPALLGEDKLGAGLAGTAIRLLVSLGLGLALALSGALALRPLLLWLALSYVALLPLDTRFVLKTP
jgi:hypothetical protein